jgi:ribose 5-phosphate isomerase A
MHEDAKKRAARAAIDELPESGIIGLGTGSTARFFVEAVAELVRGGRRLVGVCTSEATRAQARALGIPVLSDDGPWTIDVTVDGADEVDDGLDLVKGAGGALTREKIVSVASRRVVIVCDATKRVRRLGETSAVPVEVLAFGYGTTAGHLAELGRPQLRMRDGVAVRTDGGNLVFDLAVEPIDDPERLDRVLRSIPGVVETGLFVGRADIVLVAHEGHVERLARSR